MNDVVVVGGAAAFERLELSTPAGVMDPRSCPAVGAALFTRWIFACCIAQARHEGGRLTLP
jgi:hypothetical protein